MTLVCACGLAAFVVHAHAIGQPAPQAASAPASPWDAAQQALNRGRFDEVESQLREIPASHPDAAALRARAAIARGRYAEAERLLVPVAGREPTSEAALELGLLRQMLGRRAEAKGSLEAVAAAAQFETSAEYLRAARAARALGQFREANRLFREAAARAPADAEINTAWGELFLEKYNRQDAARSFQAALRQRSDWTPALVGLARVAAEENPPSAMELVRRALEVNPSLVDAHLLGAELELDQGHRDRAVQALDRGLAVNPSDPRAHALRAALAHLDGRAGEYRAAVDRALATNPKNGDVYRVVADHAARNYRFDEAVELARQAVALDPDNVRAHAELGIHLLRAGDEPGARQALDKAFTADPYDVITYNLLGLLDSLDRFVTIKDGDLVFRFHPDEAGVLREYALPLAREALKALAARYDFTPRGPILIEIFPQHDDFAVRNVGLPGMIGALGACFGRVVTLDSPRARPPGTFHWGAALWHELAHVITLQMSNQRVPRWLTEGISVYEEQRARPDWGREMEIQFARALEFGKVLPLRDLNSGFTDPGMIALAYYQASLLVSHLEARFGEGSLRRLLRAFGTGLDTPAALKTAFGVAIEDVQRSFDQMLEKRFASLRRALREPGGMIPAAMKADIDELKALAGSHPDSYPVQLLLGRALQAAGDIDGALARLERAAALVPMATGRDSPHAVMAEIALNRGDRARAIAELEALVVHAHDDIESARRLASLLDPSRDPTRARAAYERVVLLDPFDAEAHASLGRLALEQQDGQMAAREFRAALAAGAADAAAAHCDLAESYLLSGRGTDARTEVIAALEIAPLYERAQELLLKLVGDPQ